jgi:radical SAM superfamily enzyme YgiQ (UPF0313 family)
MHTALRMALDWLPRIRSLAPGAHLCFYGLYATLNAELLASLRVDSVLSGELEEDLLSLAGDTAAPAGASAIRKRLSFPIPDRRGLPPLDRYAHLDPGDGSARIAAAVETTRGCRHLCRHCPIPPIYGGRFFAIPRNTVLADLRQLVAAGAAHIDFVDPDFLNGPGHALAIAQEMHREFPDLTFNFTAKIEHLVKHASRLPELRALGCLFVISAVESLSDRVLRELDKGHDRDMVFAAHRALRSAGIAFRPTFVPFTPWSTREDYADLFRWIGAEGLVDSVDSVQLTLRLLIPPGSLLLENESLRAHLGSLDRGALTYTWKHPDPEMDRLQETVSNLVERGLAEGLSNHAMFHELAELAADEAVEVGAGGATPRLTEDWFC